MKAALRIFKDTVSDYSKHKVQHLGAALAYYAVFSIGPMLFLAISVAGIVFGREAATNQIVTTLRQYLGEGGAQAIQTTIESAYEHGSGPIATLIGFSLLFFAATALFAQLQDALNIIWEVKPKPGLGVKEWVRTRFISFTVVLGLGFLLLVSLLMTAALAAVGKFLSASMPGGATLWSIVNSLISFGVVTGIFAAIFKVLPDAQIDWSDVWTGAAFTAALFTFGEFLLSLYIRRASVGSAHGAAGSLIVVLVWVYYASQIMLFGAEFTQVYARRHGSRMAPDDHAISLRPDECPA
jgi:membrane protein